MSNSSEPMSYENNLDLQLILSQLPTNLKKRIYEPPRAESEQEKNLLYIIRQLHKLNFDDETIELILSQFTLSQGKDVQELIKKSKLGNPSEDKLSLEFAEKLKNKLRFCHSWGKWLSWSGTHWQIDEVGEVIEQIRICLRETDMPDFRRRWITVKNTELLAQNEPNLRTTNNSWDQNSWLLATPNGTVDLKTGKLRISYQEDMITKITKISPKKISIPIWEKFLSESTNNNQDYISYLKRISGYCLTGSVREQALFFLYGSGGNGKGVFLNTLTSILGDYAIAAPMGMFMENKFDNHPTELAMLRGARLVTAQETQEGKAWNEVRIKALTGGDLITARFMREDFFNFFPNFKLLIAGNHEPQLRNINDAIKRRFNKLPFDFKPSQINHNLSEELIPEYPGILNWMIEGCLEWQNLTLSPPQIITTTTQDYFDNQNNLQQWLDECCKIEPLAKITSISAFSSWCNWASRNHLRQGNDKTFKESLIRNGFKYNKNVPYIDSKGNGSRVRGYEGFRLK